METARYTFNFRSNYDGRSDYDVCDREARTSRRLYWFPAPNVARFMFAEEMPADVLAAFNDWRRARHAADVEYIRTRYGAEELAHVAPFAEAQRV